MYVIPYKVICRALVSSSKQTDSGCTPIALAVIRCLLKDAISIMPFDEEAYLDSNPDVAAAIRRGEINSAHAHYISDGYFEDREGANQIFDELWYVRHYSDVAKAIKTGAWLTGRHHYNNDGIFEWRSPNQNALLDVERWRNLLTNTIVTAAVTEVQ